MSSNNLIADGQMTAKLLNGGAQTEQFAFNVSSKGLWNGGKACGRPSTSRRTCDTSEITLHIQSRCDMAEVQLSIQDHAELDTSILGLPIGLRHR